jgi:hypothetical protein
MELDIPVISFYVFNIFTLILISVSGNNSGTSILKFIYFVGAATSASFIYHENKLEFIICEVLWALMMFLFEFIVLENLKSNLDNSAQISGKKVKKEDVDGASSALLFHALFRMLIAVLVSKFSF